MPQIAYRTVRSRRKFIKAPEVKKMLSDAIDTEVKPHYVKEFEKVVADWNHKPEFKSRKFIKPDSISVDVYPAGPNTCALPIWPFVPRLTHIQYQRQALVIWPFNWAIIRARNREANMADQARPRGRGCGA